MSRGAQRRPAKLAGKLREIRDKLGLSQNEMISRMGLADELTQAEISAFERGIRLPPLPVLLEYARAANVYVDVLIDDLIDLPREMLGVRKSEGLAFSFRGSRAKKNIND
jgi:transcriptional regulator with XRE-family HTH domain